MNRLIIRDGFLTTDSKEHKADIRIVGEKIAEIGQNLQKTKHNEREIDAEGLSILPGGIDPHVHLSLPAYVPKQHQWADDFKSGSEAALAGGITTLGCMSVPDKNETPLETLERETRKAHQQTLADILIHPVISSPTEETIQEVPQLVEEGCTTIKIFMCTKDFDEHALEYLKTIQAAKNADMLVMIHCEDHSIIDATCDAMIADGRGSLSHYAESRPIISEVVATQRAVAMSETTGAPMYVVHLSSERALKVCEEAQSRSLPVYVESRPIFLYLTQKEYTKPDGALYMVQPPLREASDVAALWEGLQNGSIHTIATDHAPHTREQKLDPSLNVANLRPGINELQVMLPMLHSKGVLEGKISLGRFVELTSTHSAKLFGLYPRKGTIQVGSDADLVLWDRTEEREVKNADLFSKAGFSIYEGMNITGWPKITIRRGEVVYNGKDIVAQPGSGQVLPRSHPQALK
ncbi:MAG: amidohydrolase family protein [Candidatus Korarchaeota archaeon]|nr:amidohydrolase family protein [Candidatus Korarchaeota archaeon]NIU84034.1 amidohydrolase family protein [Candidatus Thorarchaeota archaeon]NIW52277.1 amidohydrolase family protein [Candidatus Korarchaeota archaeon]